MQEVARGIDARSGSWHWCKSGSWHWGANNQLQKVTGSRAPLPFYIQNTSCRATSIFNVVAAKCCFLRLKDNGRLVNKCCGHSQIAEKKYPRTDQYRQTRVHGIYKIGQRLEDAVTSDVNFIQVFGDTDLASGFENHIL